MYQALYRKWRPRTFDDVVGQAHITETLKRQVREGRLSHAYLFTGTRGTGKTTCAKLLARAANCLEPVNGSPCNQCDACRGIENGSILDVLELDAASNNGVDQVRALRDEAVYSPAAVRKRVYIIDEVHMLSVAAFNALLKILEEPPEHLMFILATTELHKVPATIKSRCQQFAFKRISPAAIAGRLNYVAEQEGIALTTAGAALLARLSDGGMRDALSLLDQCAAGGGELGEREILEALGLAGNLETAALMEEIANHDTGGALERLDHLYSAGKDVGTLLNELSVLARDLLIRETAPKGGAALMTGGFDETILRKLSGCLNVSRLSQILGKVQAVTADLGRSANRRVDAELCLIRLCDERLDDSAEGLNARLTRLEEMAASGTLPGPVGGTVLPAGRPAPAPSARRPEPVRQERPRPTPPPPPQRPAEQGELPPWEMEPPPAPRPGPEVRTQVQEPVRQAENSLPWDEEPIRSTVPGSQEQKPEPVHAPAEASVGAVQSGDFWPGMVAALKNKVPRGEYCFLANPQMVRGQLDGSMLKLWAQTEFFKNMINKPVILQAVEEAAARLPGGPYRAVVMVGEAPPMVPVPQSDQAMPDKLDELVARGRQFDNITIKE